MGTLEGKLREFGVNLEGTLSLDKLTRYRKVDQLVSEARQLILGKIAEQSLFDRFAHVDVENMLRAFRERYKHLLAKLGIHICPTRKLIYRKRNWRNKRFNHSTAGNQDFSNRKKFYCPDCKQYHFV